MSSPKSPVEAESNQSPTENPDQSIGKFVKLNGAPGVAGSLVNSIFSRELAEVLTAQAAELYQDFVRAFGDDLARMNWIAISPPRSREGAPAGPRAPQKIKDLLVWFYHFQAIHPELKDRPLRLLCAAVLHKESPGEFGNSAEAIEKHLARLLPRAAGKN